MARSELVSIDHIRQVIFFNRKRHLFDSSYTLPHKVLLEGARVQVFPQPWEWCDFCYDASWVGWGGALTFMFTCTHTHSVDTMFWYLLLLLHTHTHTHLTLRYKIFSCTCTHTHAADWCYVMQLRYLLWHLHTNLAEFGNVTTERQNEERMEKDTA